MFPAELSVCLPRTQFWDVEEIADDGQRGRARGERAAARTGLVFGRSPQKTGYHCQCEHSESNGPGRWRIVEMEHCQGVHLGFELEVRHSTNVEFTYVAFESYRLEWT